MIRSFQARHGIEGMVVVADAGMLSGTNLRELDGASLRVDQRNPNCPKIAGQPTAPDRGDPGRG